MIQFADKIISPVQGELSGIPRYNLTDMSGKIVAEKVTITLQNQVLAPGTPLNAANLNQLVDGINNSLSVATAILPSGNLDNYTNEGFYYCSSNATAATLVNCPTSSAFSLHVMRHAGVHQRVIEYTATGSPRIYFRNYYNGAWLAWAREYTTLDVPTLAALGIQSGGATSSTLTITAGSTASEAYNFPVAYKTAPRVYLTHSTGYERLGFNLGVTSTATTFTVYFRNLTTAQLSTAVSFNWLAIGTM